MSYRSLLVAGLALLVVACGSDTSPEPPAADAPAAPAVAEAPRSAPSTPSKAAGQDAEVTPRTAPAPEGYDEEIHAWQKERETSLLRPDGWLSLVGLFWLEGEENTVGGVPGNDFVFPKAPERVCTLRLDRGPEGPIVTVEPEPGVDLALAADDEEGGIAELVTEPRRMVPDTEPGTTRLALGSLRFWLIERGDLLGVRVLDRQSPALKAFEGLEFFPVDPAWRIEARLVPKEGLTIAVPNVLGQVSEQPCPGEVVFGMPASAGEERRELRLLPMDAGDQLFFVFGDRTNGRATYGGGRFLYAEKPDPDDPEGRLILDFNRAYNPPCAFTEFATCPLPPRPNKLPLAIEVGEKAYAGGPAHH